MLKKEKIKVFKKESEKNEKNKKREFLQIKSKLKRVPAITRELKCLKKIVFVKSRM